MSARALTLVCVGLLLASLLALPGLVRADGGPFIPDPEAWAMIDEGQQIAVVRLEQDSSARVDLFVSMADRSGQAHELTFFLPLGVEARDFGVVEETSLAFDEALTKPIEAQVTAERRNEAAFKSRVQGALLLGALPAHGAWSWAAVGVAWLGHFRGVGAGAAPTATFETASSQVAIYDINAETDLQALIETTGLDPKVQETLASLHGQQVAVVRLRTQPVVVEEEPGQEGDLSRQAGIHLGWRSTLVPDSTGATYTYPLGTGRAWASPIELTRVYVVSPLGLDFRVDYPRLGEDLSGEESMLYYRLASEAYNPSFAVDEASGAFGRIWHVTYIQSNSAQDLVVTRLESVSREMQRAVRHARARPVVGGLSWPLCLLAGALAWVTGWRLVVPRLLGVPYRWREWRLYRDALVWAALYAAISLVVYGGAFMMWVGRFSYASVCLVGWVFVISLPLTLGLGNAYLYARSQAPKLKVSRSQAFGAYLLAVLTANACYIAFALVYAAIVGAF